MRCILGFACCFLAFVITAKAQEPWEEPTQKSKPHFRFLEFGPGFGFIRQQIPAYQFSFTDQDGLYQFAGESQLPNSKLLTGFHLSFATYETHRFSITIGELGVLGRIASATTTKPLHLIHIGGGITFRSYPMHEQLEFDKIWIETGLFLQYHFFDHFLHRHTYDPDQPYLRHKDETLPMHGNPLTQGEYILSVKQRGLMARPQLAAYFKLRQWLVANLKVGYQLDLGVGTPFAFLSWNTREDIDEGDFIEMDISEVNLRHDNQPTNKFSVAPGRIEASIGLGLRFKSN